jgi:hypothetical protein
VGHLRRVDRAESVDLFGDENFDGQLLIGADHCGQDGRAT